MGGVGYHGCIYVQKHNIILSFNTMIPLGTSKEPNPVEQTVTIYVHNLNY